MTAAPIVLPDSGDLSPYVQRVLPRSSGLFWGGRWHEGAGQAIATFNPSTGERLADVTSAGSAEVGAAVASAAVDSADCSVCSFFGSSSASLGCSVRSGATVRSGSSVSSMRGATT